MFKESGLRSAIRLLRRLTLVGWMVVYAQGPGERLTPSNMDPPPRQSQESSPAHRTNHDPEQERPWSILQYVDAAEPRFYAKLGLLLGSVLLARKAYRQMNSR